MPRQAAIVLLLLIGVVFGTIDHGYAEIHTNVISDHHDEVAGSDPDRAIDPGCAVSHGCHGSDKANLPIFELLALASTFTSRKAILVPEQADSLEQDIATPPPRFAV